ncbi:MAG: extracellular solute-binding protein [Caldilineaceae bacterium]|nr:extracellular solute-binding protein [Caldilineaceae bacterium]
MNTFSRRTFLKRSGMITAGILLAGCVPAAQPSTSAGGEQAQAPDSAQVTIRYGRWANPAEIAAGEALINQFHEAQTEVKVEAAFLPWSDYWPKVQTELAAGTAPDVIQMSVWYIVDFMENKALVPLNAYMETAGITPDKYFTNTTAQWEVNGEIGCLPSGLYAGALFYNKDMFDEAGVEYPSGDLTWDELLEIGLQLTVDANGKRATESDFDPESIMQWGYLAAPNFGNGVFEMWMMQNGGGVVTAEGECLLTAPESIQAVQFIFDLVNQHHISPTPEEMQGVGNPFLGRLVAMMQDNHSRVAEANMTEGLNYDILQMPIPNEGERRYGNYGANGNAIYARSANPDATWSFLEFMISTDVQMEMAQLKELLPFSREVANSDAYLSPPPDNMMAFVLDAELPSSAEVSAPTKHMAEWNAAAQKAYEAAWLGNLTIEQAAQQACDEITQILSS